MVAVAVAVEERIQMLLGTLVFVWLFAPGATDNLNITVTPNNMVDAGTQVVCTCHNDVTTEPPTWEINDISYLACDLPFGYETNAVNLTFVAYENSTIRCGYRVYNDGTFLLAYSQISTVMAIPTGSEPPARTEYIPDLDVIAVYISNQEILITLFFNRTESSRINFIIKDTCSSDNLCAFSEEANQLLTVSLKDQCIPISSSPFSNLTLNVSSDASYSEIEISNRETEVVVLNTTTTFMFNHLGCEQGMFLCVNSSIMSECFKHELNDIPSMSVRPKNNDSYLVNVTDVDSLKNNTIVTAICGAARNSCENRTESYIKNILYTCELIFKSGAPPHYNNIVLKALLLLTYFTFDIIF
jgi:hypothetical protein